MSAFRVKPGQRLHWNEFDPDNTGSFEGKKAALDETTQLLQELDTLQNRLYGEGKRSILIVLQAMDSGGKDGTIRHVMSGVNPQNCRVTSFKVPTPQEQAHDFLWRIHKEVPPKGYFGIFNRSHYEDVLITRVHHMISDDEAEKRFERIKEFEKLLTQGGTTILKFYLGISKEEQRKRLQKRLEDPKKRWKFSVADLAERKFWDLYQKYYRDAIEATSTSHSPWYLIPANHKWYRNYQVAKILVKTLRDMDPRYPPTPKEIKNKKIRIQ